MNNEPMNTKSIGRRDFLKIALCGTAAAAVVPAVKKSGVSTTNASSAVEGKHKWVMVIDQAKCEGCGYCVKACQAQNDINPDIRWNNLYEQENFDGKPVYLPVPCQQCENAPCVSACPVKATYHRDDGIVMMDYDRCIGCRYCEVACPYGARSFNWSQFTEENPFVPKWGQPNVARRPRGVVEKCSFCYTKIDRGLEQGLVPGEDDSATPACVVACPYGARIFGDLNDPNSNVSQILAKTPSYQLMGDMGTNPRVYYLAARNVEA